jgi:hypothetical protein
LSTVYRCGFAFVLPAIVYACREFEAKAHLSCILESGTGPGYVDLANAPVEWYLDGKYIGTVKTDSFGWSWNRLHVAEPGAHVVRVVFRGMRVGDVEYGARTADFKITATAPPTPPVTLPPATTLLSYLFTTMPLVLTIVVIVAESAKAPSGRVA